MKTNSILTVGGNGFVGRILKVALDAQGWAVSDLQYLRTSKIDITKPFYIEFEERPYIVVHLAGKAHSIPQNKIQADEFYAVNLNGTKNICLALEKSKAIPKSFIFISTVSVYGLDYGKGVTEEHPLNGMSPYAESKILAEEYLTHWAGKHGIKLTILRLPLVAGPNPPGNLGAMIRGIKTGRYFRIGGGEARKSMVLASDIAKIIPKIAEVGGTYNLTDGYHPSFAELEEHIAKQLGTSTPRSIPLVVAKGLGWFGDILGNRFPVNSATIKKMTTSLTFDDTKARNVLGWNPHQVLHGFKLTD